MISVTHNPCQHAEFGQERTELNITKRLERKLNIAKRLERILKLTSGCFRVIIIVDGGTEPQTLSAFSGHQR